MPRSAPTVDGTPNTRLISMRFIDAQGDTRAVSVRANPTASTVANIEAFVAAVAPLTNASLYQVVVSEEYTALPDVSAATNASVATAKSNIVVTAKNASGDLRNMFVPAPPSSLFVAGTDTPLIDDTWDDLFAAYLALLGTGFSIVSARFTERREVNERVKI